MVGEGARQPEAFFAVPVQQVHPMISSHKTLRNGSGGWNLTAISIRKKRRANFDGDKIRPSPTPTVLSVALPRSKDPGDLYTDPQL